MTDDRARKWPKRCLISEVIEPETIIETVFRPESKDTALVVARGEDINLVTEWLTEEIAYVPVSRNNNLIRHHALVLPSQPLEYGTDAELVAEIKAYMRRYVALSAQATSVAAAYVLLSWLYDAFNELPYLRFRGDYGTGKTRALIVVGGLCYKAFFASGASTISPIFHTLDTFRGTLIFDEADFRFTDEKAELVKILNNGNARGFPVLRTQVTPKHEFNPQAFHIFGPKIVGMRRSYEDRALESRFLTVEMDPGRASGIPLNLPEAHKNEALTLRNKLLMYRLRHRLSARLDPGLIDPRLEPRMNQILLPLLSVVSDEALRSDIQSTAASLQAGLLAERGATTEGQVLSIMLRLVGNADSKPSVGEIAEQFRTEFGAEHERLITNRWIASLLRRLGIRLYKTNGVVVTVPGQCERIAALAERYGVSESVNHEAPSRAS